MKKHYQLMTAFIVLLSMLTLKMGAQLSGVVTINNTLAASATNYTSFTTFAAALNTSGVSGPLTVNVGGTGPYTEQVTFNQITGASATNTITINGNGYLLTFNGTSSAAHTMWLNGTDYLNVNHLQVQGTNGSYAMVCVLTSTANYNTFSACSFSCPANGTSSQQNAFSWSSTNNSASQGSDPGNFNTLTTCTLSSGYYGVFHGGLTNAPYTTGNSLMNCYITDFYYYGIYAYYSKNMTVKGCQIDRLTRTTQSSYLYLVYGYYAQGFDFSNNIVEKLYNGTPTNTGYLYGFYSLGYYNAGNGTNPCKVVNNIIRNIEFNGYIYMFMYSYYGDTRIWHNTISLDQTASTGSSQTYVFYYTYGGNGMYPSIMNNNVTITRGGSGSKYGFYNGGNGLMGATVDNNNFYVNGAGGNNYIGYISTPAQTQAAWQAQENADLHGTVVDPLYTNLTTGDLHPTNAAMNNLGAPLNIGVDNLYAPRSQLTPDIGALEFLSNVCSSTPTNLSVYTPTYAICPNTNANINVNGYTSDLGVTYQWLTSTTSSVGPWTPISGANTVLYTTPNLNATTYYGVAVSCTLVGTTATVANVVNIAATTTSAVPYYESFEGIQSTNTLPNCSWYAPSLGGSAFTSTASNTLGRVPRTGTKYATFYYSPAGANYYYTNAIQLNAGITYSAALWYETEYYGYNNFTDLSILYGTTQTSVGLVSIATTAGPAVSNVYKRLGNTFTVATSGLYYVAIRATATSGSAQYLTWDDLSITIPCSANQPTVSLTTNSTTLCFGDDFTATATGADTYTWSTGSNLNTITETPASSTTYVLLSTSALSGCTSTITQVVTVNPVPAVFAASNTPSICAGQTANLSAIGNAVNYTWNNGPTNANISVSPTVSTSYTVSGTNNYGCQAESSINLVVKNAPVITVSTSQPNEMCVGETQVLTATGGATYVWVASGNGAISQGNPININPTTSTSYTVTGTDANGCSNKTFLTQNVSDCTGLKVNSLNAVNVFPNPTSGDVTIVLANNSDKTITVLDVTGRIISTTTTSMESVKVNLSAYSNGVYYVKVQSNNATKVVKVVKN